MRGNSKKQGFTLIEVVVSIAIISIVGFSIMNSFTTSNKVNRNAKEIDYANEKSANVLEKFKKDPKEYIKTMELDKTEKEDENGWKKKYKKTVYFNYNWEEVREGSSDKAYYMDFQVIDETSLGTLGNNLPSKDKPFPGYEDMDPFIKDGISKYVLYIIDRPVQTLANQNSYELYLIEGCSDDIFTNWFNRSYASWHNANLVGGIKPISQDAINSRSGDDKLLYVLRDLNLIVKSNNASDEKVQFGRYEYNAGTGSIPLYLNLKNPKSHCVVDVVNNTSKSLDLYLLSKGKEDEIEDMNIQFEFRNGYCTKTHISKDKKNESKYSGKVSLKKIGSPEKEIVHLELNEYRAK